MTPRDTDLKQVGVTKYADRQLRELVDNLEYFEAEQDIYRLAVAVAIALDVSVSDDLRGQETPIKWRVTDDQANPGSEGSRLDDPAGTLAQMISTFRPDEATAPYRYSQYLASLGINFLHGELMDKGKSLHEALAVVQEKSAARVKNSD